LLHYTTSSTVKIQAVISLYKHLSCIESIVIDMVDKKAYFLINKEPFVIE